MLKDIKWLCLCNSVVCVTRAKGVFTMLLAFSSKFEVSLTYIVSLSLTSRQQHYLCTCNYKSYGTI